MSNNLAIEIKNNELKECIKYININTKRNGDTPKKVYIRTAKDSPCLQLFSQDCINFSTSYVDIPTGECTGEEIDACVNLEILSEYINVLDGEENIVIKNKISNVVFSTSTTSFSLKKYDTEPIYPLFRSETGLKVSDPNLFGDIAKFINVSKALGDNPGNVKLKKKDDILSLVAVNGYQLSYSEITALKSISSKYHDFEINIDINYFSKGQKITEIFVEENSKHIKVCSGNFETIYSVYAESVPDVEKILAKPRPNSYVILAKNLYNAIKYISEHVTHIILEFRENNLFIKTDKKSEILLSKRIDVEPNGDYENMSVMLDLRFLKKGIKRLLPLSETGTIIFSVDEVDKPVCFETIGGNNKYIVAPIKGI